MPTRTSTPPSSSCCACSRSHHPPAWAVSTKPLLQRDAGLFEEWFLRRHLGLQLDCDDLDRLEAVQRLLMDNALTQPRVLVHRDFMPRNLMPAAAGTGGTGFPGLRARADRLRSGQPVQGCVPQLAAGARGRLAGALPPARIGGRACRCRRSPRSCATPTGWACSATSRSSASSPACTIATASRITSPTRRASSPISTRCCRAIRSCSLWPS